MRRPLLVALVALIAAAPACSDDPSITRSTSSTSSTVKAPTGPRNALDDLTCPPRTMTTSAQFDRASASGGAATPEEAVLPYASATWPGRTIAQVERTDTFALFGTAEGDIVIHVEGGDGQWVMTETASCVPNT